MNSTLWKTWLNRLISPLAIGLYVTITMVMATGRYYDLASSHTDNSIGFGLVDLIYSAHQKSIDVRLRARGPREVSPDLALLTIDEKAVATIGRWPWPRATLAKAIDNTASLGAKALAFDISFAEASQNPAQQVLQQLKSSSSNTADVEKALSVVAPNLDMDEALGKVFAKHGDKIVAGSFTTVSGVAPWPAETEFCRDLIFKRSPAAKQWDQEEVLLSVIDPFTPYMPQTLNELFNGVLDEKEKESRQRLGPAKSKSEEFAFNQTVQDDLHSACNSILDDLKDGIEEQWKTAVLPQENPNEFKFESYSAWLASYRSSSLPNAVPFAMDMQLNTPVVAKGTKHTAFFNTEQDADGTIRSKGFLLRTGQTYFPALSIKAYLVANNYNASPKFGYNQATFLKEVEGFEITNNETGEKVFDVPIDSRGRMLLNYAGPQKMYPYLSFADMVNDSPEAEVSQHQWNAKEKRWETKNFKVNKAEFLKNKILVVGATATGIYDLRVTPFEENYPGAETHLTAIDNLIQRKFFRTHPAERINMAIVLALLGLLLSLTLAYSGALLGMLVTVLVAVGTWYFDQYYLFKNGTIVSIVWPLLLTSVIYVSMTFYRYLTEERGKKELRQTFQKYVSPAIVEEILSDPQNLELGGKKAHVTMFFSDVRGFTTISEKLDPRALSDLLNSYLTPMTELVFSNRGTLDKYMGDAIMAFFGAPISYKDHAKYACRCALQSLTKLFELQKQLEAQGLPAIDIGIGLNTGDVSVGNMGSQTVRNYTVMGDAVNLASRLEGINKEYGTRIIISEFTYNEVKDTFICREVDWVRVKGKILPVKIFELIAEEKVPSAQYAEMLKWFKEGYQQYHEKAWQKGLESFSKALDIIPTDPVSKLYIERCQDYLAEPPADDWDGVFVMKTK
jgi:adenylate cyclase